MKMSLFKLGLGKEARRLMDLAIPMGQRDHSKEVVEMVKGHQKKRPKRRNSWNKLKSGMKSMSIKHKRISNLRLATRVVEHPRF
jgi:hypothetical protein